MVNYANIRDQFEEDGYVVLENFLDENECKELFIAGTELTKDLPDRKDRGIFSSTEADKKQFLDEYFLESNDKIRKFFEIDAIEKDGSLKVDNTVSLNKVGHALHYLHPVFKKITYSNRVKNVCKDLGLVDPAVVQSMYIYKNPGIGGEVVPHQDATYLYTEPTPPIGFWLALEDATIENGCLWMAKGSHKSGLHKRLVRNSDMSSSKALVFDKDSPVYDDKDFEPVEVKKGACVLLHGLVVHKSAHNKSNKSRHAYTFHVIEKHNNEYSKENWLTEGPNAPFVSLFETSTQI